MSATAATAHLGKRARDPIGARLYMAFVGLGVLLLLFVASLSRGSQFRGAMPQLLAWVGLIFITDLMPVRFWGRLTFSISLPVALAGAFVLPPIVIAAGVFLGAADVRELRGELSWERGLFNRAQVALSVFAASILFHLLGVKVLDWPLVIPSAAAGVMADFVVNMTLVGICAGLIEGASPPRFIHNLFEGVPLPYLLTYGALGLLGLLMATLAESAGGWAALAFLSTLILARQCLLRIQAMHDAALEAERGRRALAAATDHMADERRDERMVVAGELHDEVLPPLFKVHLMAQVLRQDLISGRLLDLEDDLPEMLEAIEVAQSAIRGVVGDLRRSTLGADGLAASLHRLAQRLEGAGSPPFRLDVHETAQATRSSQLLVYQVAREAMTNAAQYSDASEVAVSLESRASSQTLIVRDDGIGFDPRAVDPTEHFGLQLIEERVRASGGAVTIDSQLGKGTTVVVRVPVEC
jgi:signal transduction histidine kinase